MDKVKFFAVAVCVVLTAIVLHGCATIDAPKSATTTQKLKSDLADIGKAEADVKAQCGPQFAPLAVQAGVILSVAYGVAAAVSGDITGAIHQALAAFPTLVGDAQALKCVYDVLAADYAKFKPQQ